MTISVPIRGLTIRQPHARLIEIGEKSIELRSWTTRWRDIVVICAAAKPDFDLGYPCGVTICRATLTDVRPFVQGDATAACSPWRAGLFAWILTDVEPVPRLPVSGRLGLFALSPALLSRIRRR